MNVEVHIPSVRVEDLAVAHIESKILEILTEEQIKNRLDYGTKNSTVAREIALALLSSIASRIT